MSRRTRNIVDGHLRADLAEARGEASVPITYVDLSEDEERFVLTTFAPWARWRADGNQLRALLTQISAADDAVQSLVGEITRRSGVMLDLHTVGDVDSDTDVTQAVTQHRELWLLGLHRLFCGDSTVPRDVERLVRSEQAHLLTTALPYLLDYDRMFMTR